MTEACSGLTQIMELWIEAFANYLVATAAMVVKSVLINLLNPFT